MFILDDLNEKDMNNHRVQVMFIQSRENNLSSFILSQDYYELPEITYRANGIAYHILNQTN